MRAIVLVLCATLLGAPAGLGSSLASLPRQVAAPGFVERIADPPGARVMFYLFRPGSQAVFGVADTNDRVIWQKQVGFRPITEYFWVEGGRQVLFVTDCAQPEAELRAGNSHTRSYYFVLDARDGRVVAEGDLDTDVLDLPHRLPDAVAAAHEIEEATVENGVLSVRINHRGTTVSGRRAIGTTDSPAASPPPAGPAPRSRCVSRAATYRVSSSYSSAYPPRPALTDGQSALHVARSAGTGALAPEFAFHTAREERPYIVIDLGAVARVDRIVIENRRRQARERARDLTLWTSVDGTGWTWRWTASQARAAWQVQFPAAFGARFLMLGLRHPDYLHLARVEVFGPADPPASAPQEVHVKPSASDQRFAFGDRLSIVVPGGLLDATTALRVEPRAALPAGGQSAAVVGCYGVRLGERHTFDRDLRLELAFDPQQLAAGRPVAGQFLAVRWDPERRTWFSLPHTVDLERRVVQVTTRHLSDVAVVRDVEFFIFQNDVGEYVYRTRNFVVIFRDAALHALPRLEAPALPPAGADGPAYDAYLKSLNARIAEVTLPRSHAFAMGISWFLARAYATYVAHDLAPPAARLPIRVMITTGCTAEPPSSYDQIGEMRLRADPPPPDDSLDGFKHTVAHEVFHAFQGVPLNYSRARMADRRVLWWIESTAEFAACRLTWSFPLLGGLQTGVWPRLLDYPLTFAGNAREYDAGRSGQGQSLDYDRGWFIDQLSRSGVDFPEMFRTVQSRYAAGEAPLAALSAYLATRKRSLEQAQRAFAAWFAFSSDSPTAQIDPGSDTVPVQGRRGLPLLAVLNPHGRPAVCPPAGAGDLQQTLDLEPAYASRVWAVKPTWSDADRTTHRTVRLKVEAVELAPGTSLDVYCLSDNRRVAGQPTPLGTITAAGGEALAVLAPGEIADDLDLDVNPAPASGSQDAPSLVRLDDVLYVVATSGSADRAGRARVKVSESAATMVVLYCSAAIDDAGRPRQRGSDFVVYQPGVGVSLAGLRVPVARGSWISRHDQAVVLPPDSFTATPATPAPDDGAGGHTLWLREAPRLTPAGPTTFTATCPSPDPHHPGTLSLRATVAGMGVRLEVTVPGYRGDADRAATPGGTVTMIFDSARPAP